MSTDWKYAISTSEITDGIAECVVDGRIVAVCCVDGEYFAVDGICPHQGGSLGKGTLHGCVVRCPWHGWEYDVRDGQHQSIPAVCIETLETRVNGGALEVRFL